MTSDAKSNERVPTMGNNAVFPTLDDSGGGLHLREHGLTRRELFAAMLAQSVRRNHPDEDAGQIALWAVADADALLAALEKNNG